MTYPFTSASNTLDCMKKDLSYVVRFQTMTVKLVAFPVPVLTITNIYNGIFVILISFVDNNTARQYPYGLDRL
jgi:hypothetical protein